MPDPRYIEAFGNKYMRDAFLTEEPEVFSYTEGKIPIGVDLFGRTFFLEFNDGMVMLVIGKRGSGKTFLLRAIIDRLKQCPIPKHKRGLLKNPEDGYDIAILSDIKNEFQSSREEVQQKFRKDLLPGETPKAHKIIGLRPCFFRDVRKELPEFNRWVSINIKEMSKRDFMTLLRAESMTVDQQSMLEVLFDMITKKADFKVTDIPEMIKTMLDYKPNQIQGLINKFKPLMNNDFANPSEIRNYKEIFKRNYTVTFNLEQYDQYGMGSLSYPEVFLGMTARDILKFRKNGVKQINPLFLVIDEAARFVPNSKNPSCKEVLLESIDVDRRYGVSHLYATQDLTDLPDKIKNQSKYIFIPYNANTEIIKECLIFTGLVTRGYIQNSVNDSMKLKAQIMNRRFHWIVIDTEKNQITIIKPLPPLSNHMEGS